MMSKPSAVDTNILVYLHDTNNLSKRSIAVSILFQKPKIPSQVILEYLNVTRKLLPLTKENLLVQAIRLFGRCEVINVTMSTLQLAAELVRKYRFQLFDSIIVAASLESNCEVLYSEDMQHGLVVNGTLTIVNPFL